MHKEISICFLTMNRAAFMRDKLEELLGMYDPKLLEICVLDGGSKDGIEELLKSYAPKFQRIKFAISDRSVLPFEMPGNNPSAEINAQICNMPTHDLVVRTDPEARFTNSKSLYYMEDQVMKHPGTCVPFPVFMVGPDFRYPQDVPRLQEIGPPFAAYSFICSCFEKSAFIKNGGVHEAYARGYAAEDSYFHRYWRRNRRIVTPSPRMYAVVHLNHGGSRSPARLKLKREFTMPMYLKMLKENTTPNENNPDWQRPDMIGGLQIWT